MSRNPGEPSRELEEVAQALGQAAQLERETLAATRGAPTADELRTVAAALERARGAPGGATRRHVWWIAAGLIVGALLLWRFLPRDEGQADPRRTVLGNAEVEILEPVGELPAGAEFERIRWRTSSLGTPTFEVRVFDDENDLPLLPSTVLRAFELPLDNLDTHAWKRIRIEIDELIPGGEPQKSGQARAWRSR